MTASLSAATAALVGSHDSPGRSEGAATRLPPALAARRQVRVLFVNDTARNGGPGRSLYSILKFLDPAVVYRAVVLPRDGAVARLLAADAAADELHFFPGLVENPIEPWGRPMDRRDFSAPAPLRAMRLGANALRVTRALSRLSSLVARRGMDLIYCNGTNANFAGAALAAVTGVPALWHVRYSSLPRAVVGLHRRLSVTGGVRRIVCVSRASAELFVHCAPKVVTIHNGLDLDAFDPARVRRRLRAELGIGEDVVVFGSHGRVLRRKGYVEMIRAARLAVDQLSEAEASRVVFVVAGDTPQDFRPDHVSECRALVQQLGMEHWFHWIGFRADVRPFVTDFDVGVVPSVYPDPLPRAVMEAMALAKPVIAFDVGGVSEMLAHGIAGALVPFEPARGGVEGAAARSVTLLAEAFVRYARDAGLRARQGEAARECALRDFDARAHARRIQSEIVAATALGVEDAP